jgi:hypothetical protein
MALSSKTTIAEISAMLQEMGEAELAERLEYLASEADLDPGESAATDASARGFFEFFTSLGCDSKVGLACSQEGWIVGEWRWFPDERRVGIWFIDSQRIRFSALDKNGDFVDIEERNKITERTVVTPKMVEKGLFYLRGTR